MNTTDIIIEYLQNSGYIYHIIVDTVLALTTIPINKETNRVYIYAHIEITGTNIKIHTYATKTTETTIIDLYHPNSIDQLNNILGIARSTYTKPPAYKSLTI